MSGLKKLGLALAAILLVGLAAWNLYKNLLSGGWGDILAGITSITAFVIALVIIGGIAYGIYWLVEVLKALKHRFFPKQR